jgi:hypothetical protein
VRGRNSIDSRARILTTGQTDVRAHLDNGLNRRQLKPNTINATSKITEEDRRRSDRLFQRQPNTKNENSVRPRLPDRIHNRHTYQDQHYHKHDRHDHRTSTDRTYYYNRPDQHRSTSARTIA